MEHKISEEKRQQHFKVQIPEQDLLCKNGCGFYGTPQSKGLCSGCWRAYQTEEKRKRDYAKNRSLLSFEKFEEKRKHSTDLKSNTLKQIVGKRQGSIAGLKGLLQQGSGITTAHSFNSTASAEHASSDEFDGSSVNNNNNSSATSTPIVQLPSSQRSTERKHRHLSPESSSGREKYLCFLQGLPKGVAHELSRQTQHAVEKILANHHIAIDEIAELVQNFYQVMTERLNKSSAMNDPSKAKYTTEEVMQQVEQYICIRTYHVLFCSKTDEEVADLSLQDRIRSLRWVTAGFLETHLDFSRQSVRDKMDEAVADMININSYRAAAEKLDCLIRCSKSIFEALKESRSGAPASADEFLPVLIFAILKGNPPQIQSNLKFINRFALPARVMSGESGYFFTNLSCALEFVQSMNSESLKMPKEDFEAYTSGNLVPPLTESNCGCNQAIKCMENCVKQAKLLNENYDKITLRLDEIEAEMIRDTEKFEADVRELRDSFPSRDYSIHSVSTSPEPPREPVQVAVVTGGD